MKVAFFIKLLQLAVEGGIIVQLIQKIQGGLVVVGLPMVAIAIIGPMEQLDLVGAPGEMGLPIPPAIMATVAVVVVLVEMGKLGLIKEQVESG